MAVDRKLLQQALSGGNSNAYDSDATMLRNLQDAQGIQALSMDSNNFGGGKAGGTGLAAQLGTAAVGAYSRYKAEKTIAEKEAASQQAFASKYPQFADLAGQLSPATRDAYTLEVLKNDINQHNPTYLLDQKQKELNLQKTQADINKTNKETSGGGLPDPEKTFKNATALRQDYLNNSKTFQGVKEGYERVDASAKDPSAAGDLSLIFGYMKTLDPNSTVREGEFATAQQAGGIPERIVAQYNKTLNGERLSSDQRSDFVDRSTRLYKQAELSQKKIADQYTNIAKRNSINPEDVVIDFSTSIKNEIPAQGSTIGEGTLIENSAGEKLILRGGQWVKP
jgi:hypothetical protein